PVLAVFHIRVGIARALAARDERRVGRPSHAVRQELVAGGDLGAGGSLGDLRGDLLSRRDAGRDRRRRREPSVRAPSSVERQLRDLGLRRRRRVRPTLSADRQLDPAHPLSQRLQPRSASLPPLLVSRRKPRPRLARAVRTTVLRLAAALFAVALASCSSEKVLSEHEYHESATTAMKDESYDIAIKDYQRLLEEYPFSDYSEEA